MNEFSRFEMLVGSSNAQKLKDCHIAVFGLGGVGSFVVEHWREVELASLHLLIMIQFQ